MAEYHYLATGYTKNPKGIEGAYRDACKWAGQFIQAGIPVFSPIAHSHGIAVHGGLDPLDHRIWLPADKPMIEGAAGLIVVMSDDWKESIGIAYEIAEFHKAGKPVRYWVPGEPVFALRVVRAPE